MRCFSATETDRENSLPKTVPSQHVPAFVLPGPRSDAEYGGSDYIRVYPGDHDDTHSLSDSSSDEDGLLSLIVFQFLIPQSFKFLIP